MSRTEDEQLVAFAKTYVQAPATFRTLLSVQSVEVREFFQSIERSPTPLRLARSAVLADDTASERMSTLVRHGVLPKLAYLPGPVDEDVWPLLLALGDPAPIQTIVGDLLEQQLKQDTPSLHQDVWRVIQRVAGYDWGARLLPKALGSLVIAMLGTASTQFERTAVAQVVHVLELHSDPRFRLGDGPDHLLSYLLHGVTDDTLVHEVLARCIAHCPEYVVHAPHLVHVLRETRRRNRTCPWASALVHAAGTALVVRCDRESSGFDEIMRGMFEWCDVDARKRLVQLWPERVCQAIGRAHVEGPAVTAYECPISQMPCVDPVVASDGHTYERGFLLKIIVDQQPSPLTRQPLHPFVIENLELIKRNPPTAA